MCPQTRSSTECLFHEDTARVHAAAALPRISTELQLWCVTVPARRVALRLRRTTYSRTLGSWAEFGRFPLSISYISRVLARAARAKTFEVHAVILGGVGQNDHVPPKI